MLIDGSYPLMCVVVRTNLASDKLAFIFPDILFAYGDKAKIEENTFQWRELNHASRSRFAKNIQYSIPTPIAQQPVGSSG